jgi:RNA polymerase sporulation-specific sigma factor
LGRQGEVSMIVNKVEICGVNTSKLPVLSNVKMKELFLQVQKGDKNAGKNSSMAI